MISITTASYVGYYTVLVPMHLSVIIQSLHASTVLVKATVTWATEPPPSTFVAPPSVSEPPFCVMGISDRSFLARITLEWAGASRNKPTHVDHWIEVFSHCIYLRRMLIYVFSAGNGQVQPACQRRRPSHRHRTRQAHRIASSKRRHLEGQLVHMYRSNFAA